MPLRLVRADLVFFGFALLFLYTQLFQFPLTPYHFGGDQLIPISNALQMLEGKVMYRDFFHLAPPGTELWYAFLFSIFGVKVWILNFTILLLGLALTGFSWHFSRQVLTGWVVYLPSAIFLTVGFRLYYVDGSYRLFSVIFAFAAVAILMSGRTARHLIIVGTLCGLSSFFVQPRGVMALAGISVFILWEHFRGKDSKLAAIRSLALLAAPFTMTIFVTQAYFLYSAGFENYYFCLVTFLQKHYPSDPLSNSEVFMADLPDIGQYFTIFSTPAAISRYLRIAGPTLFFYALIPYVYLVYLIYRWRWDKSTESGPRDAKLRLLAVIGLALSAGVSAPSVYRLAHVAIPGVVILVWLLGRLRHSERLTAFLLVMFSLVGGAYILQRQLIPKQYLDMPAGRAAFLSEFYIKRYQWLSENTKPGEFFYEGHHPSYYFPFHLKNPTPMYLLRDSEYSPRFQVESVVTSLEKDPPRLIAWPRKWSKEERERAPGDNLAPLWRYIVTNYEYRMVFEKPLDYTPNSEGDIEIWERKATQPGLEP